MQQGLRFLLYAGGLGFRVEGSSFKVWGSEFRVSVLWALVGFRVAAFRNNAPQPGRGGRREAFKIIQTAGRIPKLGINLEMYGAAFTV